MGRLKGVFVCLSWYYTILSGFYLLYAPILYVMFFNYKLYRFIVDCWFSLWELYPVGLFQIFCDTKVHYFGDFVDPDENCIIIINHRTRVDWNYVWLAMYHANQSTVADSMTTKCLLSRAILSGDAKTKFVLKDDLKWLPGLGWIMQMNYFLFVKRDWREDQQNLHKFIDHCSSEGNHYRIILFPEGTDLSDDNKRRCHDFAEKNSLPLLKNVLYPRPKGFTFMCNNLRAADHGLASVYDVTLAYDTPPQTEMDLLKGNLPQDVYVNFKRYSIENLPEEEEDLKVWLHDRWRDKEISLRLFNQDRNFLDASVNEIPPSREPRALYVAFGAFIFWSVIDTIFTIALLTSSLFRFWVFYNSILFLFVTWKFGGFNDVQFGILKR